MYRQRTSSSASIARRALRVAVAAAVAAVAVAPPTASAREIPSYSSYPADPADLPLDQIVCDEFFVPNSAVPVTDTPPPGWHDLCVRTARSFYKEIQFQVDALTSSDPSVVGQGLAALGPSTTFIYPDGTYSEGLAALVGSLPYLFGNAAPVDIENKFLYKPIDRSTVVFIGNPTFTMLDLTTGELFTIDSVQLSIYRRNGHHDAGCRSGANPTGSVCWSELGEQWVYGQPMTGASTPHQDPAANEIPVSPTYPPTLEPNRILCDSSFVPNSSVSVDDDDDDTPPNLWSSLCQSTAQEFYKEIQYQVGALTSADPAVVAGGLAALGPGTTFLYPDGTYSQGLFELYANLGPLFGPQWMPTAIQNRFLYKPIDADTVLFLGDPLFTLGNPQGASKTIESVQLSVYRRNGGGTSNCRSAANMTGRVCWRELAETWVYGQPTRAPHLP